MCLFSKVPSLIIFSPNVNKNTISFLFSRSSVYEIGFKGVFIAPEDVNKHSDENASLQSEDKHNKKYIQHNSPAIP